jgi:uncharacterized protein (TIGR02466 family)
MEECLNISRKIVLIKDLSNLIDFDLINKTIDNLEFGPNKSNRISQNKRIFDMPELLGIKGVLEHESEGFLRHGHGLKDFENLIMTTSWVNITDPGQMHHVHKHPFSIVSGVIYLDDNPENLNLQLHVDMPEIPYFLYTEDTYLTLKTLTGNKNNLKNHLVLFLSNTGHGVEKTASDSMPRRSISFNTFWKGTTGIYGMDFESIAL